MVQVEKGEAENPTAPNRILEDSARRLSVGLGWVPPGGRGDLGWQGSSFVVGT